MFLAKDIYGSTTWHVVAEKDQIELFHKLLAGAKEVLTEEEFNHMLFLAKDGC